MRWELTDTPCQCKEVKMCLVFISRYLYYLSAETHNDEDIRWS
jgi:hypothetical protein